MTMTRLLMISTLVLAGLVLLPLQASAQRLSTQAANASAPATAPPPAAAADPAPRPVATTGSGGSPRAWYEEDYRLGPGDKLRIEVYGQQQLSQSLQIRPDGKITLPLVGDVLAAGKTSMQVRDDLARAFKDYVHNPVVTVIVQEATSSQVYVIGEVSAPGAQVLEGPTTILQALAQAGGLKEFADKGHIHVLRKSASGTRTIPVDYKGALKGDVDPMVLQPGDTLVVP